MSSVVQVFRKQPQNQKLLESFLRWQCRVRQMAMRDNEGRPDDAITPALTLAGETEPMGHIITVMSKWGAYSKTPEIKHISKRTNDPAQRREKALQFFSETYYQQSREFSDTLTATFPPDSPGATKLVEAGECTLSFEAYSQRFDLVCAIKLMPDTDPLYQATWWHNLLFNPSLDPQTIVLGFEPDWDRSSSEPPFV
ncbi:MAG: hypothetical protein KTR35_21420 [Gammaproteobacteria bacterium]|nr:hypothetical protein [Gammaproteobacteria bacterium]